MESRSGNLLQRGTLEEASCAVILSLGRINSLQLLAARTGGATMSASRKQQSGKHLHPALAYCT